jgi:hypothetical protein
MHYYLISKLSFAPKDQVFWHKYLGENKSKAINILNENIINAGTTNGKPTYEFRLTSRLEKLEEEFSVLGTRFKGL